jgi:microcystin-dependent protein
MSEPFIAEIRIFSFAFAPRGWTFANGQLLPINQNQAIFSLFGTTFGGNGVTNFALPNLQGNIAVGNGNSFVLGETGGEASHTLTVAEMPAHTHSVNAVLDGTAAGATSPGGNFLASAFSSQAGNPAVNVYSTAGPAITAGPTGSTGGGQPHENRMPYLTLNYCIALQGIFPSRN